MSDVGNKVKLFGMTNQLLINELESVERVYGIKLGHYINSEPDKDEIYYPQFDASVREEAKRMAEHYEVFYCLEKSIRCLISETLESEHGAGWWNENVVPDRLVIEIKKRMQKEEDSGVTVRSSDPIDYTTFGELGELIKSNWDIFGSIFNSIRALESVMGRLNTLRGPIAHCSPLAEDEVLRLKLSLKDWFRLME